MSSVGDTSSRDTAFLAPGLSIAAGAVHATAAAAHGGGTLSSLLLITSVLQIGWGVWLLTFRPRIGWLTGMVIHSTALGAWAMSRMVGLPLVPELSERSAIGLKDGGAAILAAMAIGALIVAHLGSADHHVLTRSGGDRARRPSPALLALAGLVCVVAMASPHDHDAHVHQEAHVDQSVALLDAGALSERLPIDQGYALLAVSARPVNADSHDSAHHDHDGTHDSGYDQPDQPVELSATEAAVFDRQWADATRASQNLATVEQATAAGYVQSSPQVAGVGAHWIKWSLVDRPFEPGQPSMLLFDHSQPGQSPTLVGLSYWSQSESAPDGFAGPNDVWHAHQGLCFVNGWLMSESHESRASCSDTWIDGTDLWMLHAWTVTAEPNPWGPFAAINPNLCPPATSVPDIMTCDPVGR